LPPVLAFSENQQMLWLGQNIGETDSIPDIDHGFPDQEFRAFGDGVPFL
jgi:hypothetical protein